MARKVTKTIYNFDELSEEVKDRARNWYREASSDDEWWESVYEDAERIGLKIRGFDADRGWNLDGHFTQAAHRVAAAILKDHGKVCETYKDAAQYLDERDDLTAAMTEDDDEDDITEELDEEFEKTIKDDYLRTLRDEYEYQNSNEVVDENILANEYEFDEDGNRA